ncbi:MAG: DNA cytosine methyltransferase [Anaerotignaceae bacterium]
MNKLTLGSLFSGSGGFELGGLISGIIPKWASEIEPFPIRVTTKRIPFVKHLGDISTINGAEIEPVDIITFGSPCTDMSVAGKRAGLDGEKSVLFYEAIRIIKEMRLETNGKYPRFICWENVPGAFSSNKGEDFRAVLEAVAKVKDESVSIPKPTKWTNAGHVMGTDYSIAWRTFDAQYWGVPQRRKRIYLVADFASGSARKILFESEGLSGYSPKSLHSWKGTAQSAENGTGETSTICLNDQGGQRMDVTHNMTTTLRAQANHPPCVMLASAGFSTEHSAKSRSIGYEKELSPTLRAGVVPATMVLENHPTDGRCKFSLDGKVQTLTSRMGTGGNNAPLIMSSDGNGGNQGGIAVVESYAIQGSIIGRKDENGPNGNGVNEDVSFTLNTIDRHAVYSMTTGSFTQINEEKSPTLMARDYKDVNVVAVAWNGDGVAPTLTANNAGGNQRMPDKGNFNSVIEPDYTVRRLTPLECGRLQGFPDYWCENLGTENPTDEELVFWGKVFETHSKLVGKSSKTKSKKQLIKWLQNPHSDSAQYKMWGNGVALPNVVFVLSGILWVAENEYL